MRHAHTASPASGNDTAGLQNAGRLQKKPGPPFFPSGYFFATFKAELLNELYMSKIKITWDSDKILSLFSLTMQHQQRRLTVKNLIQRSAHPEQPLE